MTNFNRDFRGFDRHRGAGTAYEGRRPGPRKIGENYSKRPNTKTKEDMVVERVLETPVEIWHKNDKEEFYAVWGTGVYSVRIKRVHTVNLSTFKYPSPIGEVSQVSLTVEIFWGNDIFFKSEFFYGDSFYEKLERYLSKVIASMEEMRQRKEDHFFSWLRQGEQGE